VDLDSKKNDPKYSFLEVGYIGKASSKNILETINKEIGSSYEKLELVNDLEYETY
jgi:hypothetical protein